MANGSASTNEARLSPWVRRRADVHGPTLGAFREHAMNARRLSWIPLVTIAAGLGVFAVLPNDAEPTPAPNAPKLEHATTSTAVEPPYGDLLAMIGRAQPNTPAEAATVAPGPTPGESFDAVVAITASATTTSPPPPSTTTTRPPSTTAPSSSTTSRPRSTTTRATTTTAPPPTSATTTTTRPATTSTISTTAPPPPPTSPPTTGIPTTHWPTTGSTTTSTMNP